MTNSRKGFSLLIAIFTIVLISVVASYIFYASSSIAKEGSMQYQQAQARLLARSYTEYAVLAISGNNRNATPISCIRQINANIGNPANAQGYQVEVDITYITNNKYINNCPATTPIAAALPNSNMDTVTVILDVYVRYKDPLHPNVALAPWQVYHKRSLQKI